MSADVETKYNLTWDGEIVKFNFRKDLISKEHTRTIYGPLDFFGDVGGLVDSLMIIGFVIISLT